MNNMFKIDLINIGKKMIVLNFLIALSPNTSHSYLHASPPEPKVPKFVYKATTSIPDFIFKHGFIRRSSGSTDLSRYMPTHYQDPNHSIFEDEGYFNQRNNPDAFVRTTSVLENAIDPGRNPFNLNSQRVYELFRDVYVYEIVPQEQFVSITDAYERALDQANDHDTWLNLDFLRPYYTWRSEYAAIGGIAPESIYSAIRYHYYPNIRTFTEVERIRNHGFNPRIRPAIYPEEYDLGTVPSHTEIYSATSTYVCNTRGQPTQNASMQKREAKENNYLCPFEAPKKLGPLEMPKAIFERNALKIQVNTQNNTQYCLEPTEDYFLYVNYCDNSKAKNKWLFTEFEQLIAEIYDGKNPQYYCLTSPKKDGKDKYVKMKICDLNDPNQKWKFKKFDHAKYSIVSYSGKTLGDNGSYYGQLIDHFNANEDGIDLFSIKILNFPEIKKNTSKPLIQFSIEGNILNAKTLLHHVSITNIPYYESGPFQIYPTYRGYAYFKSYTRLSDYQNYYNAHNNSFFSNYAYPSGGPQVCYFSKLVKQGGSSWNWVESDYCSTQNNLEPHFLWYFTTGKNDNEFHMIDDGENLLRTKQNAGYAYTANGDWTEDDNTFLQKFSLGKAEQVFAKSYSSVTSKEMKNQFAFYSLYDYFTGKNN